MARPDINRSGELEVFVRVIETVASPPPPAPWT
jgi:hypothetical protein